MQKVLFALLFLGAAALPVGAQQKAVRHMSITIYQSYGLGGHIDWIETHDDGTSTSRRLHWPLMRSEKALITNEDSVMTALRPYFDAGWEITASTATFQSSISEYVERIFLRKDE